MADPLAYLGEQLEQWRKGGTWQRLHVLSSASAPISRFDGREVINLASNNYLGLTTHPKLREAALDATRRYGVGSGAVRTISGTMSLHMELEERIAALQERRSLRRLPVRIRRQRRNRRRHPRPGRPHHLRRAEPRQHHRRLPAIEGQNPRLPAQGRRGGGAHPGRARRPTRAQAADHRRRFLDGRRYRAAAATGRSGRKARRDHDDRRRPLLRRAGAQRARHRGSFRPARPRADPGRHSVQGYRRAGRIRLRQPRPDRVSVPPRAAVPVLHLAPAGRSGLLPGCFRRAGRGAGTH